MEYEKLNSAIKICFDTYYNNTTRLTSNELKWTSFADYMESVMPQGKCFNFPHSALIEVTSDCNLRCKHCYYSQNEKYYDTKGDFTTEEWLKLFEFLIDEVGVISFVLASKEPLLYKDIFILIEYLKSKNVYVKLFTNGTLVTNRDVEKLSALLNPMTDSIQISLDGASALIHDKIRGAGTFKKTTDAIMKLSKKFNVAVAYTVNSININDLPNLYYLAKEIGFRHVMIGRFEDYDSTRSYLISDKKTAMIKLAELIKLNNINYYININQSMLKMFDFLDFEAGKKLLDEYLENNPDQNPKNKCHKDQKFMLSAKGDVYLCPNTMTENKEFCLGNLREKSFLNIWENRYNNVFFHNKRYEESVCGECKYLRICSSGCPASAFFKYGTPLAPDAFCNYGQELINSKESRMELKNG